MSLTPAQKVVKRLYDTGHFQSPWQSPNVHRMSRAEIMALPEDHPYHLQAMLSWREMHGLSFNAGAALPMFQQADVKENILTLPRCGCPDYGELDDSGEVIALAADSGTGRWPVGCLPELPDRHGLRWFFDWTAAPSWAQAIQEEVELQTVAAFQKIGMALERVHSQGEAHLHSYWTSSLENGTLGLAQVANKYMRCNHQLWQRFNNRHFNPSPAEQLSATTILVLHEVGHSVGLNHHDMISIMYPSLQPQVPPEWEGDASEPYLNQFYGGDPILPPMAPDEMATEIGVKSNTGEIEWRPINPPIPWEDRWNLWR